MRASFLRLIAACAALSSAACGVHQTEAPGLHGPSQLTTSLSVTATPDHISQDGASQSSIQVTAIGPDGRALSGIPIRMDILVQGTVVDFGSLSTKSAVTGSDGIARVVYTAPPPSSTQQSIAVAVRATPISNDAITTSSYQAFVQLMPIGVILPPGDTPTPAFVVSPTPIALNVPETFDASSSCAGQVVNGVCSPTGSVAITSYAWNFGDGGTASGRVVTHTFTATGTYNGTLTVTNDRGISASTPITVTLSGDTSDAFTGDWIFSPSNPVATQQILFNADAVKTTPGHQVTVYNWNFGDLDTTGQPTTGFLVTHTFAAGGTYNVVLSVQDDLGRKKVFAPHAVAVSSGNPTATFTSSVFSAVAHIMTFDGSGSTAVGNATIVSYQWSFGDGSSSGPSNSSVVSHAYAAAGPYQVRLTVVDSVGRTGTFQQSVTVP